MSPVFAIIERTLAMERTSLLDRMITSTVGFGSAMPAARLGLSLRRPVPWGWCWAPVSRRQGEFLGNAGHRLAPRFSAGPAFGRARRARHARGLWLVAAGRSHHFHLSLELP